MGSGSAAAMMVLEACWGGSVEHQIRSHYGGTVEGYKYRGDSVVRSGGDGGGGESRGRGR